jgi:hypothetical protein
MTELAKQLELEGCDNVVPMKVTQAIAAAGHH